MTVDAPRGRKRPALIAGVALSMAIPLSVLPGGAVAFAGEASSPVAVAAPEGKPAAPAEKKAAPDASRPPAAPAKAAPASGNAAPAPRSSSVASSSDAGIGGAVEDFIERSGDRWKEITFLGLKPRLRIAEQISYTDNVFYQAKDEKLVVNRDPPYVSDGIKARPRLGKPRGRVGDIVNIASLNFRLEKQLETPLLPLMRDEVKTLKVLDANVTSVEYLKHGESPDALNWDATIDLPTILNEYIRRLLNVNVGKDTYYFRTEATYSRITDPLDVAKFLVKDSPPTFVRGEERNDFERVEYALKGTLGWRGPVWDGSVGARYYNFRVKDRSLNSADHRQSTYLTEVGHTFQGTKQRAFWFLEYTDYEFDERTAILTKLAEGGEVTTLRDYERWRTGLGWEGPILTRKWTARVEAFWTGVEVDDHRKSPRPIVVDPDDPSKFWERNFDEPHIIAGAFRTRYVPFQKTQFVLEYGRSVEWSVVAENKIVDKASFTAVHEFNPRTTGTFRYAVENDNVAHLMKRTFQEVGVGVRYKLFKYTEVFAEYTLRHMRSRREPRAVYADRNNQPYAVRANGDFTANIVTVGVSVEF